MGGSIHAPDGRIAGIIGAAIRVIARHGTSAGTGSAGTSLPSRTGIRVVARIRIIDVLAEPIDTAFCGTDISVTALRDISASSVCVERSHSVVIFSKVELDNSDGQENEKEIE